MWKIKLKTLMRFEWHWLLHKLGQGHGLSDKIIIAFIKEYINVVLRKSLWLVFFGFFKTVTEASN